MIVNLQKGVIDFDGEYLKDVSMDKVLSRILKMVPNKFDADHSVSIAKELYDTGKMDVEKNTIEKIIALVKTCRLAPILEKAIVKELEGFIAEETME